MTLGTFSTSSVCRILSECEASASRRMVFDIRGWKVWIHTISAAVC